MLRSILSRVGKAFRGGEAGAVMIEYALVVGIISLVLIVAFVTGGIEAGLTSISTTIGNALSGASFPV